MENVLKWLERYDLWMVLVALALFNIKSIGAALSGIISRFVPSWEQRQQQSHAMRERDNGLVKLDRKRNELERQDTIRVLERELENRCTQYDLEREERQQLQKLLYAVVAQYEKQIIAIGKEFEFFRAQFLQIAARLESQSQQMDALFGDAMHYFKRIYERADSEQKEQRRD